MAHILSCYTFDMTTSLNPAVHDLISFIEKLQQEARSLKDIENGILRCGELFRATSMALGRNSFGYDEQFKAKIRLFRLKEKPLVAHTFKDRPFVDKYTQQYQIYSPLTFSTDITIDLELVFTKVPELGMNFDNLMRPVYSQGGHQQRLFFSPSKWPIIASHYITFVYSNDRIKRDCAHLLLQDFYPGINVKALQSMVGSGLFSNASEFCDWLKTNESIAVTPISKLELPSSI